MKKSIFLFFAAIMCSLNALAWNITSGKVYYFKPSSDWKSSNARFAAAFGTNDNTWYWDSCKKVPGETDLYYVISNGDYDWMIFCRMNPSTSDNNWNNKWTEAVRVYPNSGYNRFDIKTNSSWSNDFNWYYYAPPMSSVTLSNNGTSIYGGNGSSSNPYLVEAGSKIKVKAEGTKAVEDPDATVYYDFKEGTKSKQNKTNTTYEFTSSTTAGTTHTINLDGYTKISSTSSTIKSATALYFKTVTPTIKFAGAPTNWEVREFSSNTFELELPRGTHEFKIIETIGSTDSWYGNNGIMTRQYHDNWIFRTKNDENNDEVNAQIKADVEGIYKLTWDFVTNKLSVTYPTFPDLSNQPNPIYFQPTEAWKSDGARFAAYFFDDETGAAVTWKNLTDDDGDGVYEVSNDKKYLAVIFVRMNPANNENRWNTDAENDSENKPVWNQTGDLLIPMDGNDFFIMNGANFDNTGYWSLYVPTIQLADGDNSATLTKYNGKAVNAQVNRTFKANDGYYTICLPFTIDADEIGKAYQVTSISDAGAEGFNMVFSEVTELVAGQPYLIEPKDLTNPIFENVTISYTGEGETVAATNSVLNFEMVGVINGSGTTGNQYWIGNQGYFYNDDVAKLGLRTYFNIEGMPKGMRARVVVNENAATSVDNITNTDNTTIKVIENGQLIIIRNGEKFNAQGVRL